MEDFYQIEARKYFESTVKICPDSFLQPFVDFLPSACSILDVGCGSGRDMRWLKERGFSVTGFERAKTLAELAREYSGCPVIEGDFSEYDFSRLNFDAILLIGSLVHVPHKEMADQILHILQALRKNGFVYLTLKEGKGTKKAADGRVFTLWNDEQLRKLFSDIDLDVDYFYRQVSKLNKEDIWLGYILHRKTN